MDLESVRVTAAGRRRLLRVVVDSDRGVSLDDAAEISRTLSAALDSEPVMGDFPYTLEVSSPGVDRPLTDPGIPVIDVDRGGKITWHGPGQLVGYPIMALGEPLDVVAYVRTLEEALIRCCAEMGVASTRVEGRSGVWVTGDGRPDRKVGAIGIRVSRGVTMHGFALNCDCDLGWFDKIVPCGIRDAGVTSLTAEAGRPVTVAELVPLAEHHLADVFGVPSWRRAGLASLLPDPELSPAAP